MGSSTSKKRFAADDWGLSEGINDSIIELARSGKLYSVSLMANGEFLTYRLDELLKSASAKWALHLNLTEGRALSSPTLSSGLVDERGFLRGPLRLCMSAGLHRLSTEAIVAEFRAQWRTLNSLGVTVTEVNGHHHVHQLPLVYRSLEQEMLKEGKVDLRVMADPSHWASYLMGGRLRKLADPRMRIAPHMYITNSRDRLGCLGKMAKYADRPFVLHPSLNLRSKEAFDRRRTCDLEFARGF